MVMKKKQPFEDIDNITITFIRRNVKMVDTRKIFGFFIGAKDKDNDNAVLPKTKRHKVSRKG